MSIDYGKLPHVLAKRVSSSLDIGDVEVVRKCLFGSYPVNCHQADEQPARSQEGFFRYLQHAYHYEVEAFPINFRGRRLRRQDRDANDSFRPKEKRVDIALATSMLFFAATPSAYDIAIVVLGDLDFMPALRRVRMLGKRVAIASIRESCTRAFFSPDDPEYDPAVKDMDVIWLDNLVSDIRKRPEPQITTPMLHGKVASRDEETRSGLIRGSDGNEYRFQEADLVGITFDDLWEGEYASEELRDFLFDQFPFVEVGMPVGFKAKKRPTPANLRCEAQDVSYRAFEIIGEVEV